LDLGLPLEPCRREIKLKVHNASVRVAISHLTLHRLVKAHIPVVMNAYGRLPSSKGALAENEAVLAPDVNSEKAFTTVGFRENFNKLNLSIDESALWLCTDGSHSFGAPDVLQVQLSSLVCFPCVLSF
jgi:hypothetical protein